MSDLTGKTIAFLVAPEGIEQVELTDPWEAVESAGGTPRLLSTRTARVQAFNHLDKADTFDVDAIVADADPDGYDGLVLPGGVANPDALRLDEDAVAFVRAFVEAGTSGRGDLPRAVDADRGRRRRRQTDDVVAEPADRPAQRRRGVGRRGGRRRREAGHQSQA